MLKTKASFNRKVNDFEPKSCVIEKVVVLTSQDYDVFSRNMLEDYDFIKDNKDLQYSEQGGIYHCILVVGEERDDGILVQSSGYDYARYAAFLPNASVFLEAVMKQGQSSEKEKVISGLKLKDLMAASLENIHLYYSDGEVDLTTICELKSNTLTDTGKEEWSDILNADVQRIFTGKDGLQIEVKGVKAQRLLDFSHMLAGHCPEQDYEKWVMQKEKGTLDESSNEPQLKKQEMRVW